MRRKRADRAGQRVVYLYGPISEQMRAQAFHAMDRAFNAAPSDLKPWELWSQTEVRIMGEHGLLKPLSWEEYSRGRVMDYLSHVNPTEHFLDTVEIGFRQVQHYWDSMGKTSGKAGHVRSVKAAISELNKRFGQHDLGYAVAGWPGIITRVDSQYIHAEVVESAIHQLSTAGWEGPLDEFMRAHKHYRHGNNKEAMNEALKSFESTMKAILQAR